MQCKRCNKREIDETRSKRHCSICADKYIQYSANQPKEYKREKIRRHREKNKVERLPLEICLNCGKNKISEKSSIICDICLEHNRTVGRNKYYKNPAKYHEYTQKWLNNNLGKLQGYQKKYADSHKTKIKIKNHHRRERIRNLDGSFTFQEWEFLCAKYDNKCLWCNKEKELSVDHIIPIIKGGSGYIGNIQPLCRSCNSKKGKRILDFRPFGSAIMEWT